MNKKTLGIAAIASIILAAAPMATSVAAPHHGGPGMHRPSHGHYMPPPRHHYRGPGYHYRDNDGAWFWAPLAAGAIIYGAATLANQAAQPNYVPPPASAPAPVATPPGTGTVYWCEQYQGYYPTIRTCPTGWKAVPAP